MLPLVLGVGVVDAHANARRDGGALGVHGVRVHDDGLPLGAPEAKAPRGNDESVAAETTRVSDIDTLQTLASRRPVFFNTTLLKYNVCTISPSLLLYEKRAHPFSSRPLIIRSHCVQSNSTIN